MFLALGAVPSEVGAPPPYLQLSPIRIDNDFEFTPENGVAGGVGTAEDPFVIAGWEIDAKLADGIVVRNTKSHFVIRDVRIHSGESRSHYGIVFSDLANGRVENAVLADNQYGILFDSVTEAVLVNSDISGSSVHGVQVIRSSVSIERNTIHSNGVHGIALSRPLAARIAHNAMGGNGQHGIFVFGSSLPADSVVIERNLINLNGENGLMFNSVANASILQNILMENALHGVRGLFSDRVQFLDNLISFSEVDGFFGSFLSNLTLEKNIVTANGENGVSLSFTTNATLASNDITGNGGIGVSLYKSRGIRVHHNNFIENRVQAYDDERWENDWDAGPTDGGNYWSDYQFTDACNGPGQTVCTGPDGFGDLPRAILPGFNFDYYPLLAPRQAWAPVAPLSPVVLILATVLTAVYLVSMGLLIRKKG